MRNLYFFASVIAAMAITGMASADTIFSQSDWPGGGTAVDVFGTNAVSGGFASIAVGGHPGSYVEMSASHAGGAFQMWTTVTVDSWVYDPSVSGAIDSIDFSADVRRVTTAPPDTFQAVIEQGGNLYWDFGSFGSTTDWFNSSNTGAMASNFGLLMADGSWNFGINPDFSASGSPITFGYAFGVNGGTDGADLQDYDNINFTIHPRVLTPEPFTMSLGIAGIGLFVRRRAKAKSA